MRIDPQLAATSLEAQRARLAASRTDANAAGAADVSRTSTNSHALRTTATDPTESARAARRAAAIAPSTEPDVAGPSGPPSYTADITIDDILENWGTNNAAADLNGDGGVDAADLALLLSWQNNGEEAAPDLGTGDPAAPEPQFTVEGLLADWGQSDSMYDFDGDGTVGAADLAQFLSGQVDGPTGPPSFAPPTDPGDRVAQLLADWGSSDSDYDLNGDGTVDSADLAALLASQNGADVGPSTAASDGTVVPPSGSDPMSQLVDGLAKKIVAAAGGDDGMISIKEFPGNPAVFKMVDQDQDGMISGADLQGAITHSLKSVMMQNPDVSAEAFSQRWLDAFDANEEAKPSGPEFMARPLPKEGGGMDTAKLDRLVGAIERRLDRAGFGTQPPTNLHQLLNNLNLGGQEQQYVLRHLGESYPNGLGVNRMA